MAILAVGGAVNSSNTAVTSLTVTYAPTAGNAVVCYVIVPTQQAVTVKDSANNVVAQFVSNNSFQYLFCQLSAPSGITGYTVSFSSGEAVAMLVEEYSGANLVLTLASGGTGGAANQTSTNVTASTPDPGDFLIGGFVALSTQTVTSGTQRQSTLFNTNYDCRILDNTSASAPTSISITTTFASATNGWVSMWLCNRSLTAEEADGPNVWGEKIVQPRVDVLQALGVAGANEFAEQLVYATSGSGLSFSPTWGPFTMDNGWVGLAYDEQWWIEYAATPVTYSVVSGSLPPGLSLSNFLSAGGKISGTPTTVGTYSFTLRATNAFGFSDEAFSITINSAPGGGGSLTFFA